MDFALSSIALVPAWPLSARSRHSFASVKKNIPRVNIGICFYMYDLQQEHLSDLIGTNEHLNSWWASSTSIKRPINLSEIVFWYFICQYGMDIFIYAMWCKGSLSKLSWFPEKSLFSVWFWLFSGIRQDRGQRGRIYGRWGSSISPVLSNKQFLRIYGIHVCIHMAKVWIFQCLWIIVQVPQSSSHIYHALQISF